MRIAVISDIHGNAHALEAVLADIAEQAPDLTLNLGDHFSGPFEAGRAADILTARDFPSIAGNHDRWLIDPPEGFSLKLEECALPQLSEAHLDWLRALPPTRVVADEVFMCHAVPKDDMTSWLDDFNSEGVVAPLPQAHIEELGAGYDYPVLLCGHTHVARMVSLSGERLVVNPGSVGYPGFSFTRDGRVFAWSAGSPHARYVILDKDKSGWNVTFRSVTYDYSAAAALAEAAGFEEVSSVVQTGWLSS